MTSRPPSLRERQQRRVKDDLVEAVLDIVSSEGIDAATVDRIASVAGMSRGTLYAHYPSRDDLIFQAYVVVGASLVAEAANAARGFSTWTERLEAYAQKFLTLSADTTLGRFYNVDGPHLLKAASAGVGSRGYQEAFAAELQEGLAIGSVKEGIDTEATAALLVGALREAGSRVTANPDHAPAMLASFMTLVAGLAAEPRASTGRTRAARSLHIGERT